MDYDTQAHIVNEDDMDEPEEDEAELLTEGDEDEDAETEEEGF